MARRKKKTSFLLSRNFVIGYLALGAIYYLFIRKKPAAPPQNDTFTPQPGGGVLLPNVDCPEDTYGLIPMFANIDTGKTLRKTVPATFQYETVMVQRMLNRNRDACLLVNGFYDDKTEAAVKSATGSNTTSISTLNLLGIL